MSGHVLPTVSHVTSSVIRDGSKCLYDAGLNLSVGIHCRGRLRDTLHAILSCCQQHLDGLEHRTGNQTPGLLCESKL
jgi:hypothetical protein